MPARVVRFLHRFIHPHQDTRHERELLVEVGSERRGATLFTPMQRGPWPAWIVLHGVTVPGRHHAGVRRMARALAAAGQAALVPEVPSWTALHVNPRDTAPVVEGALALLGGLRTVDRQRVGLMGFSVAATWALEVAAGDLGHDLRAVVGLGGYAEFACMVRAMITGEHEWRGRVERYVPDPYGRWIVGAGLLAEVEGTAYGTRAEREMAARALHQLAVTAGRNGALAGEPVYDPLIARLRSVLPPGVLPAWDLLAPPSRRRVGDRAAGRALAAALAAAGLRRYPELDPAGRLAGLRVPVILLHGRQDTLIPCTETLRLAALLPSGVPRTVTLIRLIGHAKATAAVLRQSPVTVARDVATFARAVRRMLDTLAD